MDVFRDSFGEKMNARYQSKLYEEKITNNQCRRSVKHIDGHFDINSKCMAPWTSKKHDIDFK